MSPNDILREITSEVELAGHEGAGGICDNLSGLHKGYCEATQFMQCTGMLDCGGCDPNGPYRSGGPSSTSSPTFHC